MQTKDYTIYNLRIPNEKVDLIEEMNDFLQTNKLVNRKKQMQDRSNCFIGYASEDDLRIALHYKKAFDILYTSQAYQDHIVLPALFLARQFLELGLKYNIRKLSKFSGSSNLLNELSSEHGLQKLYNSFLEHYKCTKKNLKKMKKIHNEETLLENLELLLHKIIDFDNKSMGYRYSCDQEKKKQIPDNATIDLTKLPELLNDARDFLCAIEEEFCLTLSDC